MKMMKSRHLRIITLLLALLLCFSNVVIAQENEGNTASNPNSYESFTPTQREGLESSFINEISEENTTFQHASKPRAAKWSLAKKWLAEKEKDAEQGKLGEDVDKSHGIQSPDLYFSYVKAIFEEEKWWTITGGGNANVLYQEGIRRGYFYSKEELEETVPKRGDIVFFQPRTEGGTVIYGKNGHVGIVLSVDETTQTGKLIDQNGTGNHDGPAVRSFKIEHAEGWLRPEWQAERQIVLVLDTSGSMSGTPLKNAKIAATKFCDDLSELGNDNNIAIVSFSGSAYVACPFTSDFSAAKESIQQLSAGGGTNTNDALKKAKELLASHQKEGVKQSLLLLSDGLPESGDRLYEGKYNSSDSEYYSYANAAYETAKNMHQSLQIYTLGFFHSLHGKELEFGRRFMSDLQNAGYYDVDDPTKLEFAFGEISKDINKKSGTFRYAGDERKDYSGEYYYDDSYFLRNAYTYNPSLATMSLCFALSAFGSSEGGNYPSQMKNAENLLKETGFTDFKTNVEGKPTMDSIGVVTAHKKLKDNETEYTLLAVGIRGGGYEKEWASNFTIGSKGNHAGFENAREDVIEFLKKYISDHNIRGHLKLWITGFSRAGAVANMTAGYLNDSPSNDFENCTLNNESIYAYTFETPMGYSDTEDGKKQQYHHIHNIINDSDPVTKVAAAVWGFGRYGKDHYLPSPSTTGDYKEKVQKMLNHYQKMAGLVVPIHSVDEFTWKEKKYPQNVFLNDYIPKFFDLFQNRDFYFKDYQKRFRAFFDLAYHQSRSDKDTFLKILGEKIQNILNKWLILKAEILPPGTFGDLLKDSLKEANITNYSEQSFKDASGIGHLFNAIWRRGLHKPLDAIIKNPVIGAHDPTLCLAWMQSQDRNYDTFPLKTNSGKYRIIRINCPVNVEVFNDGQELVAAITDDKPQEIGSILATVNEDGEKVIYLPADIHYSVKISATDTGTMSYAVQEYNPTYGQSDRLVNYYDLPIVASQEFLGDIPAYSETDLEENPLSSSQTAYTLSTNGEVIPPSEELSGEQARVYYRIQADIDHETHGTVSGGGIRQKGEYAYLQVVPEKGHEFLGWYDENRQLVSTEKEFRIRVERDRTFVATFAQDNDESQPINPQRPIRHQVEFQTNGGTFVNSIYVKNGYLVKRPTDPTKTGYVFTGWYEDIPCQKKYDFTKEVFQDLILYAGWKKIDEPVSTMVNNQMILTINSPIATIFGHTVVNDVSPIIRNQRTMLPARFVAENLGAQVEWYNDERKVRITKNSTEILLFINSSRALVNGKEIMLDSPAFIENNRTYTPVRFIAEQLGAKVEWVEGAQQVIITPSHY